MALPILSVLVWATAEVGADGEQYEPDAIGYATSQDGLIWSKHEGNPIFKSKADLNWEKDLVAFSVPPALALGGVTARPR